MSTEFVMRPVGVIHTSFTEPKEVPIQPTFSHVILVYALDRSNGYALRVKPFLDDVVRGLFATRYPCRPNPIGLSTVRLLSRRDDVLEVEGIDALDGTPLLDIKPYVPEFDAKTNVRAGWYDSRPADKEGRS